MISDTIEELVFDTLYFRRTNPDASCLQTNIAGLELEQQLADALPAIEQVLSKVVCPKLSATEENHPFHGLSNLLGAYLLIGSRYDAARIVQFLHTLPVVLQAKAIAIVPVFFRKANIRSQEKEVNDHKSPPDEQLLSFIKESSQSEDKTLRENAAWALSFFLNAPFLPS